ncbi:MAG: DUF885 family protein [Lachnospiraceae bacterium]|nr:DUF885 family protein [Lachnospiraceae bacterium]
MRKRWKKIGAAALSVTLAFGSLAGCEKETKEPTTAAVATTADVKTTTEPDTQSKLTDESEPKASLVSVEPRPTLTTTETPTTEIPTTETPTTETPTTEAPTTAVPTTQAPKAENDDQKAFIELMQEMTEYLIGDSYYTATTTIERPEDYGFTPDKLTNYSLASYKISEEAEEEVEKTEKALKAKLDAIDREALTDKQKLAYDKFQYEFDIDARMMKLKKFASPLDVQNGIMEQLGIALYNFPFDEEDDLIGYQKVLETLPETLSDAIEFIKYQKETLNYEPSDKMIEDAIKYALDLTEDKDNPLLDAYDEKVNDLSLSADKKAEYIRKNREYVTGTLFDVFKKFAEDVKQFDTETNDIKGLCHYEDGTTYYETYLRALLGVEMTTQEIFDYIESAMLKDIEEMNSLTKSNIGAALAVYSRTYELPYERTSVDEIAKYYIQALAKDYPMELLPEYNIKNLPPALQIEGLGAYYLPAEWGETSPLIIRVNPKAAKDGTGMRLDSVLVHEGFGGHMLQYACADPYCEDVTKMFTELGYIEGWAVYAQRESTFYLGLSDALAKLINFNDSVGYDVEALADIGVNGLGWTREELKKYLNDTLMLGSAADEIYDFVAASPGTILPYSFGPHKTKELIEKYKEQHAADLDVKEMHRKYMSIGSASFDVVEKYFLGE